MSIDNIFFRLLLILSITCLISCNSNIRNKTINKEIKQDSIKISVNLPAKEDVLFNLINSLGDNYKLKIENKTERDTIITKSFLRNCNSQIIYYGYGYVNFNDGKTKEIKHYYLLSENNDKIEFDFNEGDILLKNRQGIIQADSIYSTYGSIYRQIWTNTGIPKNKITEQLDSVYCVYNNIYLKDNQKLLAELNQLLYLEKLTYLNPVNIEVEKYLKNISKEQIRCGMLNTILCLYIDSRFKTEGFDNIQNLNSSDEYKKHLSIAAYHFLKNEKNIGNKIYDPIRSWLKTTETYKNNSTLIDKEINPLDNNKFKSLLGDLRIISRDFKETTFTEVIKKNPSEYYLLDFWATWCAPCLDGIKRIENMDIPKNVKVINLSVDKNGVKDKWKIKADETNQKISYLIKSRNKSNIEFQKFIKLKSIPRYILIDKDLNVIDQAYLKPHEPDFLFNLKHIKLLR
jgi:thiol-disulfide isomerase/thioredoxin